DLGASASPGAPCAPPDRNSLRSMPARSRSNPHDRPTSAARDKAARMPTPPSSTRAQEGLHVPNSLLPSLSIVLQKTHGCGFLANPYDSSERSGGQGRI